MKRLLSIICAMIIAATGAMAENYPYRSDFLWVTTPNHANWLYNTGEQASVEVQLYHYGVPQDVEVSYTIGPDMLPATAKGKVKLHRGRATIKMGTSSKPGFIDLRLTANINGQATGHHIKLGFGVDHIKPYTKAPADFLAFWQDNIREMRLRPITYTQELAKEYCTDKTDCYLIKLNVDKQGHSIYAYLFIPKGAKQGGHPAVLCPPGAGIKTIKEPLRHKYYAEQGFIRMEMEIHGLDPRLSQDTFKDISRAFGSNGNNYLTNGLDSRERYYMRHVYLSLVRALDFLTQLPQWDGRNLAVQGGNQGGALAIVATALDRRVTHCVVNHPALSDMATYNAGLTGGYPHFNRTPGLYTPATLHTMAYYDVVCFAPHVKATTYMTWGYNDDTCPPTTSYAVWNTLNCPKESLITPINEHWTSDATERRQMEWIKEKLLH